MKNNEHENPVDRFELACEIVFLTILAIVVYIGGVLLIGKPIVRCVPWFFGPIGPFMILLLDVIWFIGMKKSKVKSVQVKIVKKILSVFVFALSASLLTL